MKEDKDSCGEKSPALEEVLRRISENGPMTFAEFMEVALYHPGGGYYTHETGPWGGRGDYVTSLDVSPLFSLTLARQVRQMWTIMGSPGEFTLVEQGAGRGWLAKGVLEATRREYPGFYDALKVRLVEKNPHLREGEEGSGKVSWFGDLAEAGPFTGCLLSNELVDSFPVNRFRVEGGLKEVYVGSDGERLFDTVAEPSTPEIGEYFDYLGINPAEGRSGEVNLAAPNWIKEAAALLEEGFIVTMDYGLPAGELYAPGRAGTLKCIFRHTAGTDPYVNVGRQDITSDVDFTTLARRGAEAGLECEGFTTQKNFFLGLGITEDLERMVAEADPVEAVKLTQGVKRLIMPGDMGSTFKVLVQGKGAFHGPLLGFSFRDMTQFL